MSNFCAVSCSFHASSCFKGSKAQGIKEYTITDSEIKPGKSFVEDEQLGLGGQSTRQSETLALASAELTGAAAIPPSSRGKRSGAASG